MILDAKQFKNLIYNRKTNKKYRWKPVSCDVSTILALMEQCSNGFQLVVSHNDKRYKMGIACDFDYRINKFFDCVFHIDNQGFYTLEEFKANAIMGGQLFVDIKDKIDVLEAEGGRPTIIKALNEIAKQQKNN